MKSKNLKELNVLWTVLGVVGFVASLTASLLVFGFGYIKDQLSHNGFLGIEIKEPASVIATSLIFMAVLIALTVLGRVFKNKVLLLLSASYQLLLLMALLMLVIFMLCEITSESLYTALMWVLITLLAPIFGSVSALGSFFFVVFVPLMIVTAVFTVKALKREKTKGKKIKKKK